MPRIRDFESLRKVHEQFYRKCRMEEREFRCVECGLAENEDSLLLCDGCGGECPNAYHAYCLTPTLKGIPDGNWFCPACETKRDPCACNSCVEPKGHGADCGCDECVFRETMKMHRYLIELPIAVSSTRKILKPEFVENLSMMLVVKYRESKGADYVENLFKKCVIVKLMALKMPGLRCTRDYDEVNKMILDNMPMNTSSEMLADMIFAVTVDNIHVKHAIAAGRAKDLSIAYLLNDCP